MPESPRIQPRLVLGRIASVLSGGVKVGRRVLNSKSVLQFWRYVSVGAIYIAAYLLLDKLSMSLKATSGLSLKYLPERLSLALLMGYGFSFAPLLLIRPFLSGLWIYPLQAGVPVLFLLGTVSACVYGVAATLLKIRFRVDLKNPGVQDLARFTGVILAASLLTSCATVWILSDLGYAPLPDLTVRIFRLWMGDALGIVTLTPFLLVNVLPRLKGLLSPVFEPPGNTGVTSQTGYNNPNPLPQMEVGLKTATAPRWNNLAEMAVQGLGIASASALVFSPWIGQAFHHYYFCFIPIIWIALRRGLPGASLGVLAVNAGILIAISEWETSLRETFDLQLFILTITLTSLFLGASVSERERVQMALRESERRLLRTQKLDLMDRMSGGITHHFNNLFTAISGYSELLLNMASEEGRDQRGLHEIRNASERAAELTAAISTFSRGKFIEMVPLDLNVFLQDMEAPLQQIAGSKIRIVVNRAMQPCWIQGDYKQLQYALQHLVINACEAMPAGGEAL